MVEVVVMSNTFLSDVVVFGTESVAQIKELLEGIDKFDLKGALNGRFVTLAEEVVVKAEGDLTDAKEQIEELLQADAAREEEQKKASPY